MRMYIYFNNANSIEVSFSPVLRSEEEFIEVFVVVGVGVLAVKRTEPNNGGLYLNGEGKVRSEAGKRVASKDEITITSYLLEPSSCYCASLGVGRSPQPQSKPSSYQHQRTSTSFHIAYTRD